MPTVNHTIEDTSPLIQYTPVEAWSAGSKSNDSFTSKYSDGSFTLSTTKDSSASFTFTGNRVWIFGAKRSTHGPYSATLDKNTTQHDGFSATDVLANLFDSGSLPQGQHSIVITNQQNDTKKQDLDIDYITWSTDSPTEPQKIIQIDDDASQFSYQPKDAWKTDLPSDMSGFQGDSGHVSQSKDSSAILSFSGDTVALFGAIGPNFGPYAVKIDGNSVGTFNATKQDYTAQAALYRGDGLGSGDHTLEIINQPSSSSQFLAIDFAQFAAFPTSSPSASPSSTSAAPSPSASTGGKQLNLCSGLIAGGIAAVCLAFTVVAMVIQQIHRRKRRRAALSATSNVAAFTDAEDTISLNTFTTQNDPETKRLLD
ncbi:hypothetical protein R3P38DRAFT_3447488, partial [Favolaschia claudopus]